MFDIETKLLMIFYELTLLGMCLWCMCEAVWYCISFNRLYSQERTIMPKAAYNLMQAHGLSSDHLEETSMDTYGCFWTSSTTKYKYLETPQLKHFIQQKWTQPSLPSAHSMTS